MAASLELNEAAWPLGAGLAGLHLLHVLHDLLLDLGHLLGGAELEVFGPGLGPLEVPRRGYLVCCPYYRNSRAGFAGLFKPAARPPRERLSRRQPRAHAR